MSQTNTLYIVIDPSGAQRGAASTINSINSINSSVTNLNINIAQINSNAGKATNDASRHFNSFSSIVQRLGSSVSGVAGLIAAVQPVRMFQGFIDEIQRVDRVYNSFIAMMSVTTGDVRKSALEYEYIRKTANSYGVSLEVLTKQYAKLAAATKNLMSENETKRLFESFTAVSTVLHAESYTVERMFNAIIQMASKGQIHMEELKQQLGEHLPGALALAAKSMNMEMGAMIKAMENGEIKARDLLVPLPQTLMDAFGASAEIASKSLHASYTRLSNSFFEAFKEMSSNGIALGLSDVIRAVTKHVDSGSDSFKAMGEVVGQAFLKLADFIRLLTPDDVKKFSMEVVKLVEGFVSLVGWLFKAAVALTQYSSEVLLAVGVIATYKVAMAAAAVANTVFASSTAGSALALLLVQRTLGALAAFASGWMFGTYLKNKFLEVELAGIALANVMAKAPVQISEAFDLLQSKIPRAFAGAFESALNEINKFFAYLRNAGPKIMGLLGFEEGELAVPLKLDFTSSYDSDIAEIKAKAKSEKAEIDAIFDDMVDVAISRNRTQSGSVLDKLGMSEEGFEEARNLVAEFDKLKAEAESLTGGPSGASGSKGQDKKGPSAFIQEVKNTTTEAMNQYKLFVEQLATLKEFDKITTSQSLTAQMAALENYTISVKRFLDNAKNLTNDPRQRERINAELLKVEHEYQIGMTRLMRDFDKDRVEYAKSIEQAEIDSGFVRLNNLDKFVRDWKEKEGQLMERAQLEGDGDAISRLMGSFNKSVADIQDEDRINIFEMFATDEELWQSKLVEQYDKMRETILDSTAHTYEEKHALIARLEEDFAKKQQERQVSNLLNFTGAAGQMVGEFANFAKNIAGESSSAYKALFAVSKAFAIADSMMKAQQAIATAATSGPWPANMAAMASAAAAVGNVVSTISSINFSGAYDDGGHIPAGKWGIVGEVGPEVVRGPANVTSREDTAKMMGASAEPAQLNIKNINVLDPAIVGDYLATDDGERLVMNVIQRNKHLVNA